MGDVDIGIRVENQRLAEENIALRQLLGDKIEENSYSDGRDIGMSSMVESAIERGIERGRLEDAEARISALAAENEKLMVEIDEKQTLIRRIGRELERFKQAALERNTTVNISIDSDKIAAAVERGIAKAAYSGALGPGRG